MKNILILGLVAALLFSISAGLSIWLQSSSTAENAEKEKEKKGEKDHAKAEKDKEKEKEKEKEIPRTKPEEIPYGTSAKEQNAALKDREERFARQQTRQLIALADMRAQRENIDQLQKTLVAETKKVLVQLNEADLRAPDPAKIEAASAKAAEDARKKQIELDEAERKNIEKLANVFDSASPETVAGIVQKMADEGKIDTAAKLLSRMKERSLAKVFEAMTDSSLSAQLLDRLRTLKRPTTPTP